MTDTEKLLAAKDTIIEQQQIKITLLEELAEQRRIAHQHQCRELAEHRQWGNYAKKQQWRFVLWLLLNEVWPFSLWYHRFDGAA